ncbi:Retrovirus-related Pol polyprotein from transposon TNT 1-94 [Gossypium australe]|uniref:Retrovirus-related Pol polyprotein from transposon TNT 1-94 n=1 Tax=Gossypium australe TaxID=47621 RepID=A0A5B6X0C9_9ROSI|nr:Retrovirus-related Pol polyprotein from transposon TNT 1-94 [Gossypium australe]
MEMARCLLHDKGLPKIFWAQVANTSIYLLNILPTEALHKRTPFKAWYGYKPKFVNLKAFVCFWDADKKTEFHEEDDDIDNEPIRETRSLSDIYQRCNVAVMEPARYEKLQLIKNEHPDGFVNKYKVRLVVKGYAQMFVVDFLKTFAPVAMMDTVRMLLTLFAQKGWLVHQMDAKSTFLNGYVEEKIFFKKPQGFSIQGKEVKASRSWCSRIDAYLFDLGFEKCLSEFTLYVKKNGDELLVVSLYVDDILVIGSRLELIAKFKEKMKEVFEMTNLGEMTFFSWYASTAKAK